MGGIESDGYKSLPRDGIAQVATGEVADEYAVLLLKVLEKPRDDFYRISSPE